MKESSIRENMKKVSQQPKDVEEPFSLTGAARNAGSTLRFVCGCVCACVSEPGGGKSLAEVMPYRHLLWANHTHTRAPQLVPVPD